MGESVDAEEFSIQDLRKGKSYVFRVCAVTSHGRGPYSDVTPSILATDPLHVPDSPTNIVYSNIKKDSVTLSWSAPDYNGGSKITSKSIIQK